MRMRPLLFPLLAMACGGEPENSPPELTGFAASAPRVDDTQTLLFTAVIRDADGLDDIVGGRLTSVAGTDYGTFTAVGTEGTYELELDWAALHNAQAVELSFGRDERIFIGEFTDAAGAVVSARDEVVLECSTGPDSQICGEEAACLGMFDPLHCTRCDNDCGTFVIAAVYTADVIPAEGPGCDQDGCWTNLQVTNPEQTATCTELCGDEWSCYGAADDGATHDCDTPFTQQPESVCGCERG